MNHRRLVFAALAVCVAAAFALRTIPSYHLVFIPEGVNFQETDAWFHLRTVHNLLAHFPLRSGFDPYAVFPRGENVPTGPLWDMVLGSVAWALGAGSPSPEFTDRVAAWTPAVLGASFPLLVFWLGRRLFSESAGLFAAVWIAIMPGGFLWVGHLGLADHHALETALALAALGLICAAAESGVTTQFGPGISHETPSRETLWLTVLAGVALGAFLCTRPAGVFIPAILIAALLLHPARILALASLGAFVIAILVFLPALGDQWSDYALVSLAGGAAVALIVLGADWLWQRNQWRRALLPVTLLAGLAAGCIALSFLRLPLIVSLRTEILRVAGFTDKSPFNYTVTEMLPLYRSLGLTPVRAVFGQLGASWVFAMPALIAAAVWAWRVRRPALTVFVVWSAVMTVAGFMQTRMVVYYAVNAALLAGAACAWISGFGTTLQRRLVTTGLVIGIAATSLPTALQQVKTAANPSPDWRRALAWLRDHTPEPIDTSAYTKRFPILPAGQRFAYPASAYSVAVWWDFGYWVEFLAHRIPSSNGTQSGATVTGRLLTDTSPADALVTSRELGARYIMLEPSMALFDKSGRSQFPNALIWAHRLDRDYFKVFYSAEDNVLRPVLVYLPEFFHSIAVRLYTFDGQAAHPQTVWVISSRPSTSGGRRIDLVQSAREFATAEEARAFMAQHPEDSLTLGSLDPTKTCVDLEPVPAFREVYSSDPHLPSPGYAIRSVKIFEIVR